MLSQIQWFGVDILWVVQELQIDDYLMIMVVSYHHLVNTTESPGKPSLPGPHLYR